MNAEQLAKLLTKTTQLKEGKALARVVTQYQAGLEWFAHPSKVLIPYNTKIRVTQGKASFGVLTTKQGPRYACKYVGQGCEYLSFMLYSDRAGWRAQFIQNHCLDQQTLSPYLSTPKLTQAFPQLLDLLRMLMQCFEKFLTYKNDKKVLQQTLATKAQQDLPNKKVTQQQVTSSSAEQSPQATATLNSLNEAMAVVRQPQKFITAVGTNGLLTIMNEYVDMSSLLEYTTKGWFGKKKHYKNVVFSVQFRERNEGDTQRFSIIASITEKIKILFDGRFNDADESVTLLLFVYDREGKIAFNQRFHRRVPQDYTAALRLVLQEAAKALAKKYTVTH